MKTQGSVRVGCSGWQYRHWRGTFYPADLPATRWLPFYAERFDTVEVNNTFYRLPDRAVFERWREIIPPDFVAAIKASRFLTHMKKLLDPAEPLARLFERAAGLGDRLGPVLYQVPPGLKVDHARLDGFLRALPRELPDHRGQALLHAIEFRDPSWYVPATFDLLGRYGVTLCLHDRTGSATPQVVVGPFVYIRFHGSSGAYHGGYAPAELERWAAWLDAARQRGLDVYAYFNNDIGTMAPRDAVTLRSWLTTGSGRSASMSRAAADRSAGRRATVHSD